jgi:hypothetical protein
MKNIKFLIDLGNEDTLDILQDIIELANTKKYFLLELETELNNSIVIAYSKEKFTDEEAEKVFIKENKNNPFLGKDED